MLPYTSQIAEKASFFSVPYLGYHFIIANTIRLNLAVPKISRHLRNIPVVECYVSKVEGIHTPI